MTAFVWTVGPHGKRLGEDLRLSMRSVARYGDPTSVWIAGWAPDCVDRSAVGYIEGPRTSDTHASSTANLLLACRSDEVPEAFVWMHDDFYLLRSSSFPHTHRGLLTDRIGELPDSRYCQLHRDTLTYLSERGLREPLCFELHRPMVVEKTPMRQVLEELALDGRQACKRTTYGNLIGHQAEQAPDVKVRGRRDTWNANDWCVSSSDSSLTGDLGDWLAGHFTDPCPWEVPSRSRRNRRVKAIC